MGISPVSSTQPVYSADVASRSKGHGDLSESTPEDNVPASTEVTISDAGLNKAREQEQKIYPVEYYQVPSWTRDIFDNPHMMRLGMSGLDADEGNRRLRSLSPSDRAYLQEAKTNHWNEFLKENDLFGDREKYYQTVIANKESSEQYRLKWEEKLSSDTRLMEIYEKGRQLFG